MDSQKGKHIVIDGRFWAEAGPGRYTKALVEHLEKIDRENKYTVLLRKKGYETYKPKNQNFSTQLANYTWYSFEEQILLPLKLLKLKPDLYYVPHFNVPILYFGKLVTAIPDIIMHKFSTNKATTLNSPLFMIKKFAYHVTVLNAVIRSKKIIVPTNDVKKDFLDFYKFTKKSKFVVSAEGVDPDFVVETSEEYEKEVLKKIGIEGSYLLFVSSMYRHKNPYKLIEAFKLLVNEYGYRGKLVMVGKKDYFSECVGEYVKKNNLDKKILLPGLKAYVTDKEIIALRKNCDLFVFPSLKEGFSLTPLEAQILGVPCAISNIPCHQEVYGDSVEYFDPNSAPDIAETVWKLLNNEKRKKELIEKGLERAKIYSWHNTARDTINAFNSVLLKK